MAIETIKEKMALKLELDGGVVEGRQKIVSKTFNQIKKDAADEDLYSTASVLSTLQSRDLLKVKRVEEVTLIEE